MYKKYIFKKKRKNNILFFIFLFSMIIILIFYYKFINNDKVFIINESLDYYYITPEDTEGKKIPFIDKEVLHLNSDNAQIETYDNNFIKYSIQLFSSPIYNEVKQKFNYYLNKEIYNKNDFSIIVFENSLKTNYLLVYKNFETKESANEYCKKFNIFIAKCIIVNLQNID